MILDMAFKVIGGLGIFLLGMKYMSEGMQTIAGTRLRSLINAVTNHRVMAATIGMLVTFVIQSSSVTTVMVVGFVNSGFMTLTQAIGVIMGANIGTTITGWVVLLPIAKYGLPILGVSALVHLFSKDEKARYIALVIMGFGMIFFGMELMKNGFKPIQKNEEFTNWFLAFRADNYLGIMKCVAVGCILTMIVQSSSATLVITISMATANLIHFESAAALVMGQNIGTTITAYLASLGATTNAKRAAYGHIVFNVLGAVWVIILFDPFIGAVKWGLSHFLTTLTNPDGEKVFAVVGVAIATTHSIFNIINTIIFLPFADKIALLLERLVPDKPFKEAPHLTHLDVRMLETPVIGIEQSRVEILRMGETVKRMQVHLRPILADDDSGEDHIKKIFHKEEVLDIMQKEIVSYLTDIFTENVPHDIVDEARHQLRLADEYESVGDYVANILKLRLRLNEAELSFTEDGQQELLQLHDQVMEYSEMIIDAVKNRNVEIVSKATTQGDAITHRVRELRIRHLARVSSLRLDPLNTVIYTDTLNAYRRVKDHMFNIAEVLAGEK